MRRLFPALLLVVIVGSAGTADHVPLSTSLLFSDGAVLQRDVAVPVWGRATPRASVTVMLNDMELEGRADRDGNWRTEIPPQAAGGPHRIVISSGDDQIVVEDVLFGDVWIASGQSNMEWPVALSANADQEIAAANDPLIRHYKVPRTWARRPSPTLAGGEWHPADSAHVGAFTAVGYYFAQALRLSQDVPIGILNTSWGGSRIEAWMDPDALGLHPDLVAALLESDSLGYAEMRKRFAETYGASETEDAGLVDGVAIWADSDLDVSEWADIEVPGNWESADYAGLDGVAWYRTMFEISEEAIANAVLQLGTVDDRDMTWVNGTLVGETNVYNQARRYPVDASILRAGTNTITVRVTDTGGQGGIMGGEEYPSLEVSDTSIPLAGMWKFRVSQFAVNENAGKNQLATVLYNKMIHPILFFPNSGFIWYQGESNAGNEEDATRYAEQFRSMITQWRTAWGNEAAPYLFVSLANFREALPEPAESHWATLRESQSAALALPGVGQAVIIDIGEADDIHPRNKQDVGLRLALAARHLAYGEELVYSGPIYREHAIVGNEIHVSFDHVGAGLVADGAAVGGFAIAGSEDQFVWADARIEGSAVIVSHDGLSNPTAVRYAWADNPDRANLYNVDGLPAAPFRTDR